MEGVIQRGRSGLGAGSGPGRERSIRDPGRATHPDASEARQVARDQLSDLTAAVHAARLTPLRGKLWPQSVARLVTDGGASSFERAAPWNTLSLPRFFSPSLQAALLL